MRILIIGISIAIMGIMVLPQTYSLFVGNHDFYNTPAPGNQIPCQKCHPDTYQEINNPSRGNEKHREVKCEGCHVTTAPTIEGLRQGPGGQFHAATIPSCLDCHGGSNKLPNRGTSNGLMKDANEACVACHTHISVRITWE